MTTQDRAQLAMQALDHYKTLTENIYGGEGYRELAQDLLADIMHLCKWDDMNFKEILSMAEQHFEEEK